ISGARFSVIAMDADAPGGFRYGVVDEGGKININSMFSVTTTQTATLKMQGGLQMQMNMTIGNGKPLHDMLVKLRGADESIVTSILDWIDADSTPRSGGSEDYSGRGPDGKGYRPKNRSLDSFEELLLVNGVTANLLSGSDGNTGWATFLTV